MCGVFLCLRHEYGLTQIPCRSEPARDSGGSANIDVTDTPLSRAGSLPQVDYGLLPLVSESAPLPHPDFPTFYTPRRKTQMMNKTITSLAIASLLSTVSFFALAAENRRSGHRHSRREPGPSRRIQRREGQQKGRGSVGFKLRRRCASHGKRRSHFERLERPGKNQVNADNRGK